MTNQDLLYSTGNPTQHSVKSYMGKASEKEWIRICVSLSHSAGHLKRTQHCKSGMPQNKIKHLKVNQNLSGWKTIIELII